MNHPSKSGDIQVCSISLNSNDKIRLIGVPVSLTSEIRESIRQAWGTIQKERDFNGTCEFKLLGTPWSSTGPEAVNSRRLICAILTVMARNGWNLIQSVDISKQHGDKDTLFFENCYPDPDVKLFGVSFNRSDRIRVIEAPSTVPSIPEAIRKAITTGWPGKIQHEVDYHGSHEFKLEGNPWLSISIFPSTCTTEAIYSRVLLNQLLANLRSLGFKLYASIDMNIGTTYGDNPPGELESWVFRKVGTTSVLEQYSLGMDNMFGDNVKVCSISLNSSDKLRLIGVPTSLTSALRESIKTSWGEIQGELERSGVHEFKLIGTPWSSTGSAAVRSRRLLNAVLTVMAKNGWNLIQSVDVSKRQFDKDTLFFENCAPDPDVVLFGISFNRTDRIRIIGNYQHILTVREAVKDAIKTAWCGGIDEEDDYYGSHQFKLEGSPWWASGSQSVYARILLNQLLANMRVLGFKLYASADVSRGVSWVSTQSHDLETWVFRKVGPMWS